ncbi:KRAB [Mytilus edulis]|uniref:KRAB n=1 Tax=Mytilus edulis TaxID=6550 RepID=A0A8S3UMB0_MYTED|nr:KRAB [Mytilus edulis]
MLACRICPKQFWHLDSLLQHHDMQLPEKRTDCGHVMFHIICDVCLIRRDNWIRATDSIICFCETCDKTYTSLLQFNHHVILLHGERKQCTFCKKDFLLKREFRDHVCERLKKLNHSYKMEKFVICYKMTVPLIQKLSKRQKLNVQKVKGSTNTNNGIICNNYEAEGDNCTRKAENDINTTDGGNGTHYLAEGSNGTHYLAEGGNGAHYLAGKKKTVSTKDSASKIVKTPSELFIRSCTLTDSKSEKETYIVRRINTKTEAVTRSNTKAEMVANSNTEAEMVTYSNTGPEMVSNITLKLRWSLTVTLKQRSSLIVTLKQEMVTNSNTEAEMVTNSSTEVEMVTFSNTEADMVANSNTEAEMVANSNTEAEMVAYSNTEAEMGAYSNTEAVMVANSNTEAEMVTNSNTEAEMVTNK